MRTAARATPTPNPATSRVCLRWANPSAVTATVSRNFTHCRAQVAERSAQDVTQDSPKISTHSFDWSQHWYPVGFTRDFVLNKPTKVTLFDVDYVIVSKGNGDAMCLLDRCPHRLASLSTGRVTEHGDLQCAYHGWSFDAAGKTTHIPQAPDGPYSVCATALPCYTHLGLIWVWPGPGVPAHPKDSLPAWPEIDEQGMQFTGVTRDMPVDATLLLENIVDYDHGLFAHQITAFDLYSATKEIPVKVEVEVGDNSFHMKTATLAVPKYAKPDPKAKKDAEALTATVEFFAPCHVRTCRRDKNGVTAFQTVFWVVPTGLGKSRFILGSVAAKKPPPRWLTVIFLNRFLDEDTYLLATQQAWTLPLEAAAAERGEPFKRRASFKYFSPTDKILVMLGAFLDQHVSRMPNRVQGLKQIATSTYAGGSDPTPLPVPPRSEVLDRWSQHTAITPSSMDVVTRCKQVAHAAAAVALVLVAKLVSALAPSTATLGSALWGEKWVVLAMVVVAAVAVGARKLADAFKFQKTDDVAAKDLARVTKVYPDRKNAMV